MRTYLTITDGFEPNDFEFFNECVENEDQMPFDYLSQLTFFANMTDSQIRKIKECCNAKNKFYCFNSYLETVTEAISKAFGESAANIITFDLKNNQELSTEHNKTFCVADAQNILYEAVKTSHISANMVCETLTEFYNGNSDTKLKLASILASCTSFRYHPIPAICKKTHEVTYCDVYSVTRVLDFFFLMGILAIKNDKPVKRCKNCDKCFIPVSKRDEIYCLDCRSISYDQKIKENDILSSYRRIYKKQSARKQRNSHRPMIDEKFEQWKNMAVTVRAQCQAGIITLDEMETAISSQDWLDGKGGTNGND